MTTLLAGLALGFVGSGHCLAMCGPLVLTVTRGSASVRQRVLRAILYHLGRAVMYGLLGVTAGLAGLAISVGGLGRALAVGAGVVLIVNACRGWLGSVGGRWSAVTSGACGVAGRLGHAHPIWGAPLAGAMNALLPCGLVYAALTAAAALADPVQSLTFMLLFGIGTIPALLGLSFAATWIPGAARLRLKRAAPFVVACVGVLLIARGLASGEHHHPPAGHEHAHQHR